MSGAPLDSGWKLCSNEELGVRSEGGGFAANIYGAMPERGFLVTSHSYDTSRPLEKGRAKGAG